MSRRDLMKAGIATGAGLIASRVGASPETNKTAAGKVPFKLKYAPHFGMFRHHAGDDPVDQLKFAADEGFRAWEDNGMMGRPPQEQERIAKAMSDLGMQMGVFVAHAEWSRPIYARGGKETQETLREQMRKAVQVAERVSAKWCTVVPGPYDRGLEWAYQTANAVDCLKAMCEVCEPAGLVMVLEPLNPWANHPGMFLSKIPQAYQICRAVGSPSCKILNDLYHQQVTEGNLIPNIDKAWDEIAYFQMGDNPGRNEPTTGEINYRNVFRHIHSKNFTGVLGMEHGNSKPGKDGERAVIEAYQACDDF
ncbi:MAG: TIM barrel protein [Armatimonadetes bacterium]|nr:TIM barrel protein [Armatimonadota bacterium]